MKQIVPERAYSGMRENIDLNEYITKVRFNLDQVNINYKHGLSYLFASQDIPMYDSKHLGPLQDAIASIEAVSLSKEHLGEKRMLTRLVSYRYR